MGVVYEGEDRRLLRPVALKFLPVEWSLDQDAKRRFQREARAAASLDHPNICTVFEVDETKDGQLFIAMARYDGRTLKQHIVDGPLSVELARDVAIQTARGLGKAHQAGVVHRDIKPANLMLTEDGVVKILDFGIAKIKDTSATSPGQRFGTTAYMSPEQLRAGTVDGRTDIWSLGITLYEMLTGERPFDSSHELAVIYSILNEDLQSKLASATEIPEDLRRVIRRCLAKEPADRYQSAEELLRDLEGSSPGGLETRWTAVIESRRRMAAAVLVLAAVVVAMAFWLPRLARPVSPVDIAVLPLASVGAEQELVDGLAYVVASALTSVAHAAGDMSVVPFGEIIRDSVLNASDAAELYGVSHVLAGSVAAVDRGSMVTLDLIDATTGRSLDSRQIAVAGTDLLSFGQSIRGLLAEIVHAGVDPADRRLAAGQTSIESAYQLYLRAQGHLQIREDDSDVDVAIELLEVAVSQDPSFGLAYAALGEAYLVQFGRTGSRNDSERAIQASQRAVALSPEVPEARLALAGMYLATGDFPEAERELLGVLEADAANAAGRELLAQVYLRQGRVAESEQQFIAAVALDSRDWRHHNALGIFYHGQGEHEKALASFMRVVDLRPANAWGYNNVGAQYRLLGRLDEAAEWYLRAREVNPRAHAAVSVATANAAGIYYLRDDFELAASLYRQAIALDPRSLDGWENLGNSYHWLGRTDEARVAWERVVALAEERLDVNPSDGEALEYLTETFAKLGRSESARETIDRLIGMEHVEASHLLNVVKTFEILGDREQALFYVGKAIEAGADSSSFVASAWLDEMRTDPAYRRLIRGQATIE
jgi:serine/threonine-protein kinase